MALAFPGQSGSLWEIMARDSSLEALGEPSLRTKILEREPSTLDEALKIASRLEALGKADAVIVLAGKRIRVIKPWHCKPVQRKSRKIASKSWRKR